MKILLATLVCLLVLISQPEAAIKIFEDEPAFITGFTHDNGTPAVIAGDAHFGTRALRITCPVDATTGQIHKQNCGWNYDIVANPVAANEVRWIMFAWKKIGPDGIMMQFATPDGWADSTQQVQPPAPVYRYFAGTNFAGWSAVRTGWNAPSGWQLEIRDLYADFGAFTMKGIAFTPYNGVGLFDSIYLGKSYSDLLTAFQPANTVVRVEAPEKVNEGEYFNVNITISNVTNMSGFSFTIHYNNAVISAKSVTEGNFLKSKSPTFWMEPDIDNSDNIIHQIICVRTQAGGVSGSGTLLSVKFRAADNGETAISLQELAISDAHGQLFPVALENASLIISDFPPTDVNGDGKVDVIDFIIVGQNYGEYIPSGSVPNPDVNRNGRVDLPDLILLASHFGEVYWSGAPGISVVPATAKPLLESMLEKVMASDEPDSKTVAVLEALIARVVQTRLTSWGSIKAE